MADSMNITHSIAIENVSESDERLPGGSNYGNNRSSDARHGGIQAPMRTAGHH